MATERKNKSLYNNEEQVFNAFLSDSSFSTIRQKAFELWKDCPTPTSRDEYWKYTRVAPILNKTYELTSGDITFDKGFIRDIDAYNLIFINGIFSEKDSSTLIQKDAVVSDLNTVKKTNPDLLKSLYEKNTDLADYFSLLNGAFYQNGPFIWLGDNYTLDKPVHIIHVISEKDRLVNIKGYVKAGINSKATLLETWDHNSSEDNLINSQTDYEIGQNANLEVIRIQSIGSSNHLISQEFVEQQRDSVFTINTISMEGKMIRNNIKARLNGEGSSCNLNGLYMLRGEEHVDNHTTINHAVPNCTSNELYKGIMNDKSKGVFNGKVIVSRDAQKTNAFQYNGNILLTNDAQIYSKPELEIYADDVKCSHGSTTGQLDEEALFYLQSRGISKTNARNLLLGAFALEVLERISLSDIKEKIEAYISGRYHTNQYDR